MVKYAGYTDPTAVGPVAYDPTGLISRSPDRSFYTMNTTAPTQQNQRPYEGIGKMAVNIAQPGNRDTLSLGLDGIDEGKQPGVVPSLLGSIFGDLGYTVGDILDTPFDILGSIPALGPNSYKQDQWDADIQRAYEYEANQNPLNALLSISKASRLQWERDVERGVAPGPAILSDMLGPSASLGNQIYNLFMGLGVPARLIERTVVGANGRVETILSPSEEALKDPWVSEMYQRYQAGDFGTGQEARDRIMDEMVLAGRGYTDNPWVAIGLSVITDPLILLSVGAGIGTAVAGKGAATIASRLGSVDKIADAARGLIASERNMALADAAHLYKTNMVVRDEALMKAANQFPTELADIRAQMTRAERWSVDVEPTLRPIKRIVDKINDPFSMFFGGGNAGKFANGALSHSATEGALSAHDLYKVTGWLNGIRKTDPALASTIEKSFGVYAANLARFSMRDWVKQQVSRGSEWLQMHPDSVVAKRLLGFGSDIKAYVEDYARRVRPMYLPSGAGEVAEATALTEMREAATQRLIRMGVADDDARRLASGMDRDLAAFVDATYFGKAIDDLLTAKAGDEATGDFGNLSRADHDRLAMAGPRELLSDRAAEVLAEVRKPDPNMEFIRESVRKYEALYDQFAERELTDADLIRELDTWLSENMDGFGTAISDPTTLGPKMRDWAETNADLGYRPMLGPKEGTEWRPYADSNDQNFRVTPFIGYTNEAASMKHYNDFQRWRNRVMGEVRGSRIVAEARRSFTLYGASRWGITAEQANTLFGHLMGAANEAGVTPRGLDAEAWYRVVMKSDLPPDVLGKMRKRDAVDAMLASFEGSWWTVGATQKFTGALKRATPDSNALGRMAEAAYPLVRFQLNAFFQLQELIEAPFFNILHGIKPGWNMTEQDEITARVVDMIMSKGRWTFDDQIEYSRHVLAGAASARRGFGPNSKLGRWSDKFTVPVRRVKMVNYYRLTKKNMGEEFYQRLEEIKPGAWAELRDHYGTANKGDIAVRYLSERLHLTGSIEDRNFEGVEALIAAAKPPDLGARTPVTLTGLSSLFGMKREEFITGLANGTMDPVTIRSELMTIGATDDYIERAVAVASMGYSPDDFWLRLRESLPAGQRGAARGLRQVWQARARAMGLSEEEFLARHMADVPRMVEEAILKGMDEVDRAAYKFMAEAILPDAVQAARRAEMESIPVGVLDGRVAYVREYNGARHVVVEGDNAGEVWSRGRIVEPEELAAIRARGEAITSEVLPRSPLAYAETQQEAYLHALTENMDKDWWGATVNPRTGEKIIPPPGQTPFSTSVADTVEVPITASQEELRAAIIKFTEDHRDLLEQEFHHVGIFRDPDKGTIDIDVSRTVFSEQDAEALQLVLNRGGGAYNFDSGMGVYAPQLDPFPSSRPAGGVVPRGTLTADDWNQMLPPRYIVESAPDQAFAEPVESVFRVYDGQPYLPGAPVRPVVDIFIPGGWSRLDDPENVWTFWEEQLIFAQMINPRDLMKYPGGEEFLAKVFRGVWNAKESNLDTPEAVINRFVFASLSPGMKVDLNQAAAGRLRVTSQDYLENTLAPMIDDITATLEAAGLDINDGATMGFAFQVKQGLWKNSTDPSVVLTAKQREAIDMAKKGTPGAEEFLKKNAVAHKPGFVFGNGDSEFYIQTPGITYRGRSTSEGWGRNLIWMRDYFLHERPEVRAWFLKGAEESREAYAERMSAVLPGLQLKTAYFAVDVGGPHRLNRAIIDTQIMGHHLESIFGLDNIPATWDEALKNEKFAALYGGQDDVGDWVYHGSMKQFHNSIKQFGVNRGDWINDPKVAISYSPKGRQHIVYRARRETMVGGYEKAPGWYGGPRIQGSDLQYSTDGGRTWKWAADDKPVLGAAPAELKSFYEAAWAKVRAKKPGDDPWAGVPNADGVRIPIIGTIDNKSWRTQVLENRDDAVARARAGIREKVAPEHPELADALLKDDDILIMAMNKGDGAVVAYGGKYRYIDEVFEIEKRNRVAELRRAGRTELADLMEGWTRAEYQWFNWDVTRGILNPESSMHGKADAIPAMPHDDLMQNLALGKIDGTGSLTGNVGGPEGRTLEQAQHAIQFMQEQDRILGATVTLADNRKLLVLTEHADVRTLLHESFHIFSTDLDPSAIRLLKHEFARATNTPSTAGHALTRDEEEWVADLFHEYFRTGEARIPSIAPTLSLFRNWLTETYGTILNRQQRAAFDAATAGPARDAAIAQRRQVRIDLGKAKNEVRYAEASYSTAANKVRNRKARVRKAPAHRQRQVDASLNRWGYAQRDAKVRLQRAREEVRRLEKELRKAQEAVDQARALRAPKVQPPRATVGVGGTMTVEVKQFFDSLFKEPPAAPKRDLNKIIRNQGGYDEQEEIVFGAAHAAALAAEEQAFTTHFYRRGRSWLERSMNHPYFGLYPLSYMWGKVLPEMIRFLVKEPFGVPAPGAGLMASQNIYRQVAVQKEFDPEFREFMANNEKGFRALSMLLPATPWDIPVNAPLWVRRFAEIGAKNANREPGTEPRTIGLKEAANITTDMASYAFGPAQNFRVAADFATLFGTPAVDFGAAMFNEVETKLGEALNQVEAPTGFLPTE